MSISYGDDIDEDGVYTDEFTRVNYAQPLYAIAKLRKCFSRYQYCSSATKPCTVHPKKFWGEKKTHKIAKIVGFFETVTSSGRPVVVQW